ncbi:MAG: nitrous oxide reductase accessory protein NosL [Dissulfurispiraceae bacterium]|jgi:nitrous oxide reductase accessory protein NosL
MRLLGKFTTSFAILSILILLFSVRTSFAGNEADAIESPKTCKVCGMDRNVYARSRMLIVYADGTTVGLCSLHCAADEMKENKDKQVKSIMVADYETKKLIDAKTAIWVIGGIKTGVMTNLPEWAFADQQEAQAFMKENGGRVSTFDEALQAAEEEIARAGGHGGHDMSHMVMEPGSQMLFNPAFSDHIYHVHPAGMWMVDYDFMHTAFQGLRAGTHNVNLSEVGWMRGTSYNYMMIPQSMTMDMHMVMVMYGITDRLTVMAMTSYQAMQMKMMMDMGPMMGTFSSPPMSTSGVGDSELRAMYKVNDYLVGSLGLSLPTGDVTQAVNIMGMSFRAPYDMQNGSGTYDLKPALTYNGLSDDAQWNWGAQAQYTWHTGENDQGWRYGNSFKATGWLQRALGPFTGSLRLAYSDTTRIVGQDSQIQQILNPMTGAPMPDADPNNYGGTQLDGLLGVSYQHGPFSVGVEGGIPLYQNLNGLQLKTSWTLNACMMVMF